MQLHHLHSIGKKPKKRVGRGGKRGTYSGRGIKGQKSRSGHRIRPAIRDLIMRLPKRRGFANRPFGSKPFSFNISDLVGKLKPLANGAITLDKNLLKEINMLPSGYRGDVKLLGDGEIDFAVVVKGLKISKGAKMKIEKAGGRVDANNANNSK